MPYEVGEAGRAGVSNSWATAGRVITSGAGMSGPGSQVFPQAQFPLGLNDLSSFTRELQQPMVRAYPQGPLGSTEYFGTGLWDSVSQAQQRLFDMTAPRAQAAAGGGAAEAGATGLLSGMPAGDPGQMMMQTMNQLMNQMMQAMMAMMTMMMQMTGNNGGNNLNNDGGKNRIDNGGNNGGNNPIHDGGNNGGNVNPGVNGLLEHANSMVGLDENRNTAEIQKVTGQSGINPANTTWCAAWAMNMLEDHGVLNLDGLSNRNYCPTIKDWGRKKGIWQEGGATPKAGDAILFDWNGDGTADHIGIVEKVEGGKVYTIEGNSSDKVSKRSYALGSGDIDGYLST